VQLPLLIIFFISGISALIYQVTWQRLMTVYYGVGSLSITLIVSIYMLGLGLGALLGGRLAETRKDPIGLYFWIELGIGVFGLLSFSLILTIGRLTAGSPYAVAACYEMIFFLVPTILMGMSLPVLIKIFSRIIPDLSKSVSRLYCVNTIGGAAGALLASYYLISFYGIKTAIDVAATLNLVLALGIFLVRKLSKKEPEVRDAGPQHVVVGSLARYAPVFVFVTGFLAIGYELIWFRVIVVLVKSSPYAFASVLAVYLTGIALGSYLIGKVIGKFSIPQRVALFFKLQVLIAVSVAAIFIGYYYLTLNTSFQILTKMSFGQAVHPPLYYLLEEHAAKNIVEFVVHCLRLGTVLIWPAIFMLIPTILMGASFPLIVGVFEKSAGDAWTAAKVYFFNVMGNVLGGLVTGLMLLPVLGSEWTALCFVMTGLLFAFPVLLKNKSRRAYLGLAAMVLVIVAFFPKPGEIYRVIHPKLKGFTQYFLEGQEGVVMTYVKDDGTVQNFINGDSHGGRPAYSFYVQVIQAAAAARSVENVLIIGYGTGSITEGILKIPFVKKVTVVELNKTLLRNLQRIPLFQELMKDPRLEFVVDDGRRFLQSHNDLYDIVFMSPLRATAAYSNNIYSQQFFELVSTHLSESGVFVVWTDALDATFRTLDAVFPYKQLFVGKMEGFYIVYNQPIAVVRDAKALKPLMYSFNLLEQNRILAASQGFEIVNQDTLRAHTYEYAPAQDWLPLSEYYWGLWFSKHWQKTK
jgi:spermidine synthase